MTVDIQSLPTVFDRKLPCPSLSVNFRLALPPLSNGDRIFTLLRDELEG